jgi:wyosine [tRNA(Phe)-imidazoG37] synthetase (radical SAM superfamily)
VGKILSQVSQKLNEGVRADYITLSGSGEPTLNSHIGVLIRGIKKLTEIPVAVLTNGSLLWIKEVRESLMEADVVLPSLDAFDQEGFEIINRPDAEISFEKMVMGLIAFSNQYPGEIWLEVFILDEINCSVMDAMCFKYWINKIRLKKVQINTAVRPAAESHARAVTTEVMNRFRQALEVGDKAEVIGPFKDSQKILGFDETGEALMNLLARRPCTLDDMALALSLHRNDILKRVDPLVRDHAIVRTKKGSAVYYHAKHAQ